MTHTKGPWVVHKRQDEDEGTLVKHIGENDDVLVCDTNVSWRYPKVNAANARLIATLPDLLEALKEAIEFANAANKQIAGQDLPASSKWLAIVAKAEGRS